VVEANTQGGGEQRSHDEQAGPVSEIGPGSEGGSGM
jgi:hypothetical protein